MTTGQWEKAAWLKLAFAPSTFARLKKQAIAEQRVEPKGKHWVRKSKIHALVF
jgi:hypothetical protein